MLVLFIINITERDDDDDDDCLTALFCASANGEQAVADAIESFFVLESFNVKKQ